MIKKFFISVASSFVGTKRERERETDREKCESNGNLLLHFTTAYKESE
jgi:hypothetical protein